MYVYVFIICVPLEGMHEKASRCACTHVHVQTHIHAHTGCHLSTHRGTSHSACIHVHMYRHTHIHTQVVISLHRGASRRACMHDTRKTLLPSLEDSDSEPLTSAPIIGGKQSRCAGKENVDVNLCGGVSELDGQTDSCDSAALELADVWERNQDDMAAAGVNHMHYIHTCMYACIFVHMCGRETKMIWLLQVCICVLYTCLLRVDC